MHTPPSHFFLGGGRTNASACLPIQGRRPTLFSPTKTPSHHGKGGWEGVGQRGFLHLLEIQVESIQDDAVNIILSSFNTNKEANTIKYLALRT